MIVIFEKEYLQELYVAGKASDPKSIGINRKSFQSI